VNTTLTSVVVATIFGMVSSAGAGGSAGFSCAGAAVAAGVAAGGGAVAGGAAGDADCAVIPTAKRARHAKPAFLSGILVPRIFICSYIISALGQRASTTKNWWWNSLKNESPQGLKPSLSKQSRIQAISNVPAAPEIQPPFWETLGATSLSNAARNCWSCGGRGAWCASFSPVPGCDTSRRAACRKFRGRESVSASSCLR
jgi:hypothetical protein